MDAANFLQGLITNDMTLLDGTGNAMYAMMLNVQVNVFRFPFLFSPQKFQFHVETKSCLKQK